MANVPPPLPAAPVVGPLPRQQIGPFLTMGVDKDADLDAIEAAWAQRLIWARKNLIPIPLEEINWARDSLKDHDKRIRADAASLNLESSDGLLRQLKQRFQGTQPESGSCKPIDVEKSLAQYVPATPVPSLDEVRASLPTPQVPREFPAVAILLYQILEVELNPWEAI